MNWAQTHKATADQMTAQEIVKSPKGRNWIKKIAKEQGLAQIKEKKAQDPSIDIKCQIALIFLEGNENPARKKKCEGLTGCVNEEEISAVAAM